MTSGVGGSDRGGAGGEGGDRGGAAGSTGGSAIGGRGGAAGSGGRAGSAGSAGDGNGGRGTGGARDGGMGGARVDAGPPDAGAMRTIHCGTTTCTAPGQFCCIDDGAAPRCVATGAGVCPNRAERVRCDDRSDCSVSQQICCASDPPGNGTNGTPFAVCELPANCAGPGVMQRLCDPSVAATCVGSGGGACRADNQSVIAGYPYCH
jgi:hypothetical protein